jgi:Family of unknown function (DUF6527)
MNAASRVRWLGQVESRAGVAKILASPGDAILVSRAGHHRWLIFSCPCGCGTELPVNLDRRTGAAWRLYNPGPKVTLYPSVWRESGCEAHFILSHGRLIGMRWDEWFSGALGNEMLIARVGAALRTEPEHYAELAERVNDEPWDVLRACRELVDRSRATEGSGDLRGHFSLVGSPLGTPKVNDR